MDKLKSCVAGTRVSSSDDDTNISQGEVRQVSGQAVDHVVETSVRSDDADTLVYRTQPLVHQFSNTTEQRVRQYEYLVFVQELSSERRGVAT